MKITEARLRALIRETLAEVSTLDPYRELPGDDLARAESGGYVLPDGDYLDFEDYPDSARGHLLMIQALRDAGIKRVHDIATDGAVHSIDDWESLLLRHAADYDETPLPGVARTESGGYTLPNGDYLDFADYEDGVSLLDAHMQMIRDLEAAGIRQVVDDDGDGAVHSLAAWKKKVRRAQAGR